MSQNLFKNSFGKVIFQILVKIKMTRNKNRLFNRHFKTVQYFVFVGRIMIFFFLKFFIVHTLCANFFAKFRWESGFLRLGP